SILFLDQKEKLTEKAAHDSKDFNDIESKTYDDIPPRPSSISLQMSMIDSLKLPRRKLLDTGTQKAYSVENVNEASGHVGVLLKTDNAAGFGMNIQGSMNEGIYVKTIVPMGAADQTGNILPGDRIKSLTINFDNMVYEDALTLLSYASPYKVKFELERRVETPPPMDNDDTSGARIHPLFRSNTLTHIHFNPIGYGLFKMILLFPCSPYSWHYRATQALSFENPTHQEPTLIVEEEKTTNLIPLADTDLSKMESSDYASDNTSDYRESENEGCGNGNQPAKVDPAPPPPTPPPPSPPPPIQESVVDCPVQAPARTSESSSGPPEIVEARVSRIPKRTDSVKTPIIERKLPPLPKSITQRSHSAEEKDVWSRLYTDKRNMLRKTRGDVTPKTPSSTDHETTTTTTPPHFPSSSGQLRPPTDFR
ncbi:unnamed protein product, partial [Haemonchus placei]|uniref:PDZ domain-containing protein n=1 Tax=Haemonchus placei TaxID=6290 RepID=A0A0N4WIA9_HAEPC